MGSARTKVHPPSRPMKHEAHLPHLPPPLDPSNPRIEPSPNPNLGSAFAGGSDEDVAPMGAEVLSREEVLRRRSRRVKRLLRVYRQHYWDMMEKVRIKHRDYYWEFGKSPLEEDDGGGAAEEGGGSAGAAGEGSGESGRPGVLGLGLARPGDGGGGGSGERRRCGLGGCKSYAMPLTGYCHSHILLDKKQTLYKACSYVIKSAQSGQIVCGKPVLRAAVPSLCPVHFQKAQKHVSQALKKAGLNGSASSRSAPKFHVIIAEYLHQVQSKRREALNTSTLNLSEKDEKVN